MAYISPHTLVKYICISLPVDWTIYLQTLCKKEKVNLTQVLNFKCVHTNA